MHITFVIPYFYPAWEYGGTPRVSFELARGLIRRGHEVTVFTTDSAGRARIPPSQRHSNARVEGIEVLYFPNISNYLAFRHRLFMPLGLSRMLKRHLKSTDVLHIHEFRSTLTVPASSAAQRQKVPYVLSPHGGLTYLGKRSVKRMFDNLFGNSILEHAAILAAVSPLEESEAKLFNFHPARVRLLPNAIFPDDYASLPVPGKFRDRWALKAKTIILFLGRLHWVKGVDLLIRAFVKLREQQSDAHLVLAGPDDGQKGELERLVVKNHIGDRVTFTGYLDDLAKRQAFVDSDLLVIPSRSEVFAVTALEALMCGTPVLLSSACGLAPMPPGADAVRHFQSDNVDDLAQKLRLAVDRSKPAINEATMFVSKEFSATAIAQRAESLYYEAIDSKSPRKQ